MLFVVGLYFQNNNKKKQKMIWPILEKIVNTYSRIWLLILVPGFPIYIYIISFLTDFTDLPHIGAAVKFQSLFESTVCL